MPATEQDIDRQALDLITRHGERAVMVAAERLNACIDQWDWVNRDVWARIVHRIHEHQQVAGGGRG